MTALWDYPSPLGVLTLAEEGGALVGLWMEGQKHFPAGLEKGRERTDLLGQAERWLEEYFTGSYPGLPDFPMAPQGTQFQQQVWALLRTIPYGHTTTYAALAAQLAQSRGLPRMSAQAVGNAVGRNPISILIPCHRVVGTGGQLTGYAGGLERKRWLLDWERNSQGISEEMVFG